MARATPAAMAGWGWVAPIGGPGAPRTDGVVRRSWGSVWRGVPHRTPSCPSCRSPVGRPGGTMNPSKRRKFSGRVRGAGLGPARSGRAPASRSGRGQDPRPTARCRRVAASGRRQARSERPGRSCRRAAGVRTAEDPPVVWATPAAIAGRGVFRPGRSPTLLEPGRVAHQPKASRGSVDRLGMAGATEKAIVVPVWSGWPSDLLPADNTKTFTFRRRRRRRGFCTVPSVSDARPKTLTFGGAVVPRTAVRERPLHWVASPEGAGGATGSGRGREPAAGSFSRFLPAAAGSRSALARAPARTRRPLLRPPGGPGPPPHQFRGFSLDTVIRGLSNTCPREVTDGEVTLIWEIPVKR